MSALRKDAEKKGRAAKKKDKRDQMDAASNTREEYPEGNMLSVLTELRNLRKEHTEASQDRKTTLSRVESTLSDVLQRTAKLEQTSSGGRTESERHGGQNITPREGHLLPSS